MSIRFYFVRHGQSESNLKDDYYYNDEDAKLTELGMAQAAKAGYELKKYGVKFRAIFCSPYKRATQTCKIALIKAGMQNALAVIDDRLGERRYDGLVGHKVDDVHNRAIYDYKSNQSELDQIESLEALEARAKSFIDEVVDNYYDGDILVFSHGAFGLAFRAVIQGRPETGNLFDWKLLENGEIMVLEVCDIKKNGLGLIEPVHY